MKSLTAIAAAALVSLSTLISPVSGQEVSLLGHGSYAGESTIYGNGFAYKDVSIWADISVQNLAYNKDVGIIWTDNNWYSWNFASASYEGDLGNGFEAWGVDVAPCGTHDTRRYGTYWLELNGYEQSVDMSVGKFIEYAIYYTVNGTTYWDNNNGMNHIIYVINPY